MQLSRKTVNLLITTVKFSCQIQSVTVSAGNGTESKGAGSLNESDGYGRRKKGKVR